MKKKWIAMLLVVCLCMGNILPTSASSTADDTIVNIPDEWLKEKLMSYDSNGDGQLTNTEMERITSLAISNYVWGKEEQECIEVDLTGLEYATNLQTIHFSFCTPKSFDNIKSLTKLTTLGISSSDLKDASGVSQLENLERLELFNNQLTSVPNIEGLAKLNTIDFSGNQITEIPSLEKMTNLKNIDFSSNQITEVPYLGNMGSVGLSNNQITDISNLTECVCRDLYLDNNPIADITPLVEIQKNVRTTIRLSSSDIISWENIFKTCVEENEVLTVIVGNQVQKIPNNLNDVYSKISIVGETANIDDILYELKNTEIAEIRNKKIYGKSVGKTEYIAKFGDIEKKFQVEVVEREKSVGSTLKGKVTIEKLNGDAGCYLDDNQVLWGINTNKIEQVQANVKQYIAELVYGKNNTTWGNYLVLDNENTLWKAKKGSFNESYQSETLLKNVETFDSKYALLENGILYELNQMKVLAENVEKYCVAGVTGTLYALTKDGKFVNVYTNEVYAEAIEDAAISNWDRVSLLTGNVLAVGTLGSGELTCVADVEKILCGQVFMKTDGSVWKGFISEGPGGVSVRFEKMADEAPIYLDSAYMIDSEYTLWSHSDKVYKVMEGVKSADYKYITKTDGTLWKKDRNSGEYVQIKNAVKVLGDYILMNDGTLFNEDNYVVGDVVDFASYGDNPGGGSVYAVRTDGSVWIYIPDKGKGAPMMLKEGKVIKGDISGDGNVTILDVQMIFSHVSEATKLTDTQLQLADVNGDGKVTANDMQRIFYYVNGKVEKL